MDCKKALQATGGDLEKALDELRKQGLATRAEEELARHARKAPSTRTSTWAAASACSSRSASRPTSSSRSEQFKQFTHDLAMHVAAAFPKWVTRDEVPADVDRAREGDLRRAGQGQAREHRREDRRRQARQVLRRDVPHGAALHQGPGPDDRAGAHRPRRRHRRERRGAALRALPARRDDRAGLTRVRASHRAAAEGAGTRRRGRRRRRRRLPPRPAQAERPGPGRAGGRRRSRRGRPQGPAHSIDPETTAEIGLVHQGRARPRRRPRHRRRRRQHLPRHGRRGRRASTARPATTSACSPRCMNALALQDALEHQGVMTRVMSALEMQRGLRAVHPPPRPAPPREGPRRDLRRRHRQPVLQHRLGGGAARPRARRRRHPHGQARVRRRLQRRPRDRPVGRVHPRAHAPRGDRARSQGHGHHGAQPLHGQPHADPRLQDDRRQHRPRARRASAWVPSCSTPARGGARRGRWSRGLRAHRPPGAAAATPGEGGGRVEKELLADAKHRMDKAVEAIQAEFNTVRSGRASVGLLDRIHVDYYGTSTPLKQMANDRRARAAPAHRAALRQDGHEGGREGDPRVRPRAQPEQRRQRSSGCPSRRSPRSAATSS